MFLRENKFEVDGIDPQRYKKQASSVSSSKKSEDKIENNSSKVDSSSKIEDKTKSDTSSITDNPIPTLL